MLVFPRLSTSFSALCIQGQKCAKYSLRISIDDKSRTLRDLGCLQAKLCVHHIAICLQFCIVVDSRIRSSWKALLRFNRLILARHGLKYGLLVLFVFPFYDQYRKSPRRTEYRKVFEKLSKLHCPSRCCQLTFRQRRPKWTLCISWAAHEHQTINFPRYLTYQA